MYVSEEGKVTESGVKPMGNAKKRTIFEYKKEIDDGKDSLAIADSDDKFGTFLQYHSGLHEYVAYKRGKTMQTNRDVPKVYIRIGTPGTGKSRWLGEQFSLSGWVEAPDNTGRWFDGCDASDVIVFNDVECGACPPLNVFKTSQQSYLS